MAGLPRAGLVVFLPGEEDEDKAAGRPEERLLAPVREAGVPFRTESAHPALTRLRLVKSAGEIAAIRRAVEITCAGQRAAMRAMAPELREYEIEAVVEFEFTRAGARFNAFPTIVGSGPNSCVLHYSSNERMILPGEVVVIDAGAEYGGYAADVTRTLPSSGAFDAKQSRIYAAVLSAQRAGLALVRPGSSLREVNERVNTVLKEKNLDQHVVHSCCHFVGLDVHDLGSRDAVLEPGMVLTVEPGVYIPKREIGVRIEDTVLVVPGGHEVLSACAPKDPEELKAEMALGAERRSIRSAASADRRP